ncbi:MAG: hypothetical protein ACR2PR_09015 [Pseudohongiellaceae bacterium]
MAKNKTAAIPAHEITRIPGVIIRRDDKNQTSEMLFPSVRATAAAVRQYCLPDYLYDRPDRDDITDFYGGDGMSDGVIRAENPAKYDDETQLIAKVISDAMQPITALFAARRKSEMINDFAGHRPHAARAAANCPRAMIRIKRETTNIMSIAIDATIAARNTNSEILHRAAAYTAAIAVINAAQKKAEIIHTDTIKPLPRRCTSDIPKAARTMTRFTTIISTPGTQTPITNIAAAFLKPFNRAVLIPATVFFAPAHKLHRTTADVILNPHREWNRKHSTPGTFSPSIKSDQVYVAIDANQMRRMRINGNNQNQRIIKAAAQGCLIIAEQIAEHKHPAANDIATALKDAANIFISQLDEPPEDEEQQTQPRARYTRPTIRRRRIQKPRPKPAQQQPAMPL